MTDPIFTDREQLEAAQMQAKRLLSDYLSQKRVCDAIAKAGRGRQPDTPAGRVTASLVQILHELIQHPEEKHLPDQSWVVQALKHQTHHHPQTWT